MRRKMLRPIQESVNACSFLFPFVRIDASVLELYFPASFLLSVLFPCLPSILLPPPPKQHTAAAAAASQIVAAAFRYVFWSGTVTGSMMLLRSSVRCAARSTSTGSTRRWYVHAVTGTSYATGIGGSSR